MQCACVDTLRFNIFNINESISGNLTIRSSIEGDKLMHSQWKTKKIMVIDKHLTDMACSYTPCSTTLRQHESKRLQRFDQRAIRRFSLKAKEASNNEPARSAVNLGGINIVTYLRINSSDTVTIVIGWIAH